MSNSVFKGEIDTGDISATFNADFSNVGSVLLVVSYAEEGGMNPKVSRDTAAPGQSAHAALNAPLPGMLEVWVVAGQEDDSGRLTVGTDGGSPTKGSVRWVYSVVAP